MWGLVVEAGVFIDGGLHDLGIEALLPLEQLARVGCHAAEDGGHGALGAPFAFLRQAAGAKLGKEVVVLLLMAVAGGRTAWSALVEVVDHLAAGVVNLCAAHVSPALAAVDVLSHRLPGVGQM